jgi:hypothetical protein
MHSTLELPDPLFARLTQRSASAPVILKQPLRTLEEQGLGNAGLFALFDA